jgi:prepilin-type N-terminal cleavage/methylation domain-containing protein
MNRGFTVVELTVVIIVIGVLTTLVTASYAMFQNQSKDSALVSYATIIKSGAEKFHAENNEYPFPSQLNGNTTDYTTPPPNYNAAATLLNTPKSTFDNNKIKLVSCHTACIGTPNKQYIYYLSKFDGATTATRTYVFPRSSGGTCTYTLPSPEPGGTAHIIAFWSHEKNEWQVARSNRGTVTTSDNLGCPFRTL